MEVMEVGPSRRISVATANWRREKPAPARLTHAHGRGFLEGGKFPPRPRARGNPPRRPVRVTQPVIFPNCRSDDQFVALVAKMPSEGLSLSEISKPWRPMPNITHELQPGEMHCNMRNMTD